MFNTTSDAPMAVVFASAIPVTIVIAIPVPKVIPLSTFKTTPAPEVLPGIRKVSVTPVPAVGVPAVL